MKSFSQNERMAYAMGARKVRNEKSQIAEERTADAMERIAKAMESMEDVITRAVYNGTKDALFNHWREYQS